MDDTDIIDLTLLDDNYYRTYFTPEPIKFFVDLTEDEDVKYEPIDIKTEPLVVVKIEPDSKACVLPKIEETLFVKKEESDLFDLPIRFGSPDSSSDGFDDEDDSHRVTNTDLETVFSGLDGGITPPENRLSTPSLLKVPLFEYQKLGLEWMIEREKKAGGGILADQMGLGKTVQSLALIFQDNYVGRRTTLIVCPASLTRQWKDEVQKYVSNAKVLNYHEKKKTGNHLCKYDVVIASYQRIVIECKQSKKLNKNEQLLNKQTPLFSFEWKRVILDEAHKIRNRRTHACRSVNQLRTINRWCLTGTPIQNRISDAFAYIQFLRFPKYSKWSDFSRSIGKPFIDIRYREHALHRLHTTFKIICLRREKTSVLDGEVIFKSAEKTIVVHECIFSEEERDFYLHVEQKSQLRFERYSRRGYNIKEQMSILALLTQLRQVTCHPDLVKVESVSEIKDEMEESDSEDKGGS